MRALFEAGLRPSWSRASVTWQVTGKRYYIHPGELPSDLPAADIVMYAKKELKLPRAPCCSAPASYDVLQFSHQSAQTEHTSTVTPDNLVIALQQDLALAKQRAAVKTVECCYLHRKLQRVKPTTHSPPHVKAASTQTSADQAASANQAADVVKVNTVMLQLPEGLTLQVAEPVVQLLEGPITAIRDWFSKQYDMDLENIKRQAIQLAKDELQVVRDKCATLEAELLAARPKKKGRK